MGFGEWLVCAETCLFNHNLERPLWSNWMQSSSSRKSTQAPRQLNPAPFTGRPTDDCGERATVTSVKLPSWKFPAWSLNLEVKTADIRRTNCHKANGSLRGEWPQPNDPKCERGFPEGPVTHCFYTNFNAKKKPPRVIS